MMDTGTKTYPFFSCNPERQNLFSVNEGIHLIDALENASGMINTAMQLMSEQELETTNDVSAYYLIQFGYAVMQSVLDAMIKARQKGGNPE